MDAIMDRTTSQLLPEDTSVLTSLQEHYNVLLSKDDAFTVSDIFGAATGNVIRGYYGHGSITDTSYWDEDPNRMASAFWAGLFASHFTGRHILAAITRYFPTASALGDQMATEMSKGTI